MARATDKCNATELSCQNGFAKERANRFCYRLSYCTELETFAALRAARATLSFVSIVTSACIYVDRYCRFCSNYVAKVALESPM